MVSQKAQPSLLRVFRSIRPRRCCHRWNLSKFIDRRWILYWLHSARTNDAIKQLMRSRARMLLSRCCLSRGTTWNELGSTCSKFVSCRYHLCHSTCPNTQLQKKATAKPSLLTDLHRTALDIEHRHMNTTSTLTWCDQALSSFPRRMTSMQRTQVFPVCSWPWPTVVLCKSVRSEQVSSLGESSPVTVFVDGQ